MGRPDPFSRHGYGDSRGDVAVGGNACAREVGHGREDDRRRSGRKTLAVGRDACEPDVRERNGDAAGGERDGDAGDRAVGVAAGDGVAQPSAERRGAGLDSTRRVPDRDSAGELCGEEGGESDE